MIQCLCYVMKYFYFDTGELNGHDAGVKWCSFSPDGNLLATASDDASVKVWEVGALRCIATLRRGDSR